MKCSSCGKTIPNGSAFCNRCGEGQSSFVPPPSAFLPPVKSKRRAGSTGGVYKRGNTWTARVRKAKDAEPGTEGKVKYIQVTKGGFKTKTAALQYLDKLIVDFEQKITGIPKSKQNLTVAHYWATYEKDSLPKLSRQKQVNYITAYNRLKPLWNRLISTITISDLRNIVSETCPTFYPAKDVKVVLTRIFELAAVDRVADKELPSFIILPERVEKGQDAFAPDEAQRILALWDSGYTFAGYILLMMTTSMMPGELLNLRKDMINLDDRTIVGAGLKTKQRKRLSIVFPSFMIPVIRKLILLSSGETLLPKMSYSTFRKQYYSTLEAANCRKLTPYACRHTTATILNLDPSLSPAQSARVMRHSTQMSERYTHPSDDVARESVEHIQRLFNPDRVN